MASIEVGPNRVLSAENLATWDPDGVVKIRPSDDNQHGNVQPVSLVTAAIKELETGGEGFTSLKVRREGQWVTWSSAKYLRDIKCAARAFIQLGLEPMKSVAILGFNSPEWFLADVGAIFAGGIAVGLYPTNNAEANEFLLKDSRANILVLEKESLLERAFVSRSHLPDLKAVVIWSGDISNVPNTISWDQLMAMGTKCDSEELEARQRNMAINQCCTLVYTSGTTGKPKGVMLSHDNISWTIYSITEMMKLVKGREMTVSYLPLSHIAAQMLDIWHPIFNRATVVFADKMALKGTLVKSLQDARPTYQLGVPRVWEKFQDGIKKNNQTSRSATNTAIIATCRKASLKFHLEGKNSLAFRFGQKYVFPKVRAKLGLDRCTRLITAAAPISLETFKFFLALDMPLIEVYGLSETCGPQTLSLTNNWKLGSCGKTLPGALTCLANQNANNKEGEVCMYGRNITMGYLGCKDKTNEAIDMEGWFHSGDIGQMDDDGFFFITGRIKELLVTAGGENIAPIPMEDAIKKALPCISNAIIVGDRKKFISVLLTFQVELDAQGKPTDRLSTMSLEWCSSVGSKAKTIKDILSGPDKTVMKAVQEGVDVANKSAVSRAATVRKWTVLPVDMSIEGGELGPTLKLKRFFVNKKYERAIDKFYE